MKSEKISIEKNTVQETLIIPLYGRKICSEKFPELYTDEFAKKICDNLDYDFSEAERKKDMLMYEFGSLEAALRQLDIMYEIKNYLKEHPKATIVNLGCGLDESARRCDNGLCKFVNIDFPDIIEIREKLISLNEREENIACDIKDFKWMDNIDNSQGAFFFAAGVFHYFKPAQVKELVLKLSKKYHASCLVFDSVGRFGLKLMLRETLKNMRIKDVEGFFYVNNPKKDLSWSKDIEISSRGYMLGYYDMKSKGIALRYRLLAILADKGLKMSINKIYFK